MASKNIVLKEATYNGVESIELPQSGGGNALFTEVSDTTATASDVASGKYFYTAAGVKTEGTASGGGGGFEYETGTFSPDSLESEIQITFANTHTTAPFFYMILDTTGTYFSESNRNHSVVYANFNQFFGEAIDVNNAGSFIYGNCVYRIRSTSATSMTGGNVVITTPYTDPADTGVGDSRYWATETGIKAYTNSTSRYWSPNRTYSWVAVWTPTT